MHYLSNPNKVIDAPIGELGESRGLVIPTACLPCGHVVVIILVLPSSEKDNAFVVEIKSVADLAAGKTGLIPEAGSERDPRA